MNRTKLENAMELREFINNVSNNTTEKTKKESKNTKITKTRYLEIFEFTDYTKKNSTQKITENRGNIKALSSTTSYDNVLIAGIGLGHLRGIYNPIKAGDFVIVGWLDRSTPIILGSVNDYFSTTPDKIPNIKDDEMILVAKTKGSLIYFDEDGDILIKNENGGEILIDDDGVKASGYKSSDGTAGISQVFSVRDAAGTGTTQITVKNGLITDVT